MRGTGGFAGMTAGGHVGGHVAELASPRTSLAAMLAQRLLWDGYGTLAERRSAVEAGVTWLPGTNSATPRQHRSR